MRESPQLAGVLPGQRDHTLAPRPREPPTRRLDCPRALKRGLLPWSASVVHLKQLKASHELQAVQSSQREEPRPGQKLPARPHSRYIEQSLTQLSREAE